ncbi:hypothetical protein RvY_07682-2 [Ramazzottius varieornatus]|uniref:Uncharacterized protein n=1 Tax=Ramazzottius varieornatus TaxID=947166 RepID=A0A1D1V833_RAMVA|nr:hypothetical protein RvY_07682-2 [Ramazzottius varieornatus]
MVQIVWISVVSLPVILIDCQPFHPMPQGSSKSGPLTDTDIGGLTLWIVGFLCEFFADLQKYKFKQDSNNDDRFCTKDLWTWSRHPNYFGEIIQWWGIFTIYTETIREPWMWIGIISPLFITCLLLFLQVPALEQHSDVRFAS